MHRAVTVTVVLAVLVGSVPAAATLAAQSPSESEPGAAFAGVVGVQEAEVNSEVANRSLEARLNAAETNASKASVVARESDQLADRLSELEAEKVRLQQAYENGTISKGEYEARLAVVAAELRSIERQANQTAEAAETLPEQALEEQGANVSEVHEIASTANDTRGEEVAEAARSIAGEDAGGGLGNAPENATDRAENETAPESTDSSTDHQNSSNRSSEAEPPTDAGNESGESSDAGSQSSEQADSDTENQRTADRGGDAANGTDATPTETVSSLFRTISEFSLDRDIASRLPVDWMGVVESPGTDAVGG